MICLVDSDNERDFYVILNYIIFFNNINFNNRLIVFNYLRESDNRSVMPLDVRGCTRATMEESAGLSIAERHW